MAKSLCLTSCKLRPIFAPSGFYTSITRESLYWLSREILRPSGCLGLALSCNVLKLLVAVSSTRPKQNPKADQLSVADSKADGWQALFTLQRSMSSHYFVQE